MRKANRIPTWAIMAVLGVSVVATLACNGKTTKYPTQPPARDLTVAETSIVQADFEFEVGGDGLTVIFTDTSTGNVTKYNWKFGDGTSSAEQNPVKKYRKFKTYVVTLSASNSLGVSRISKFVELVDPEAEVVEPPPPVVEPTEVTEPPEGGDGD